MQKQITSINTRSGLTRYTVAVAGVLCAHALQQTYGARLGSSAYLFSLAAVMVAAWLGGLWSALLATALAITLKDHALFGAPRLTLRSEPNAEEQLILFLLAGALLGVIGEALRRARQRSAEKEAEAEQYRASSRRAAADFRALVENVHDHAIFPLDGAGNIAGWNRGAARMVGYEAGEIVGWPYAQLCSPESTTGGELEGELRLARSEGQAASRRWYVRRDGARFWADGVLTAMRDERGQVSGFTQLLRDTTARRRAEAALRQSEERFQLVARATNDAVWDWDLKTNEVWWNDRVEELFGYHAEETRRRAADGRTWWQRHVHPDDCARVEAGIAQIIADGANNWANEYRFARADGTYSAVLDRGYLVRDEHGQPARMIGAMMDITERKQAEAVRLALLDRAEAARREAEHASRVKDEFLALVSHELCTPLTTIKTLTRLLQRNALAPAEQRESLETIRLECDRQIDLVQNLLDSARLEAGALELQAEAVDVAALLKEVQQRAQLTATFKQQELIVELPPLPLPPARADRAALRRALSAIIENAFKYTPNAGRVTLSAAAAHASTAGAAEEIVISIADNGRGIWPEDLPHAFEKFYRGRAVSSDAAPGADASSEPQAPGVGLGLYLARTIIEQLGGRITVASTVGRGSVFIIYLPAWRYAADVSLKEHYEAQVVASGR